MRLRPGPVLGRRADLSDFSCRRSPGEQKDQGEGEALRDDVSKTQIDSWTAGSKAGWRFPLAYTPAWCWATGSERLAHLVAERLGLRVMSDEAAERAEIQREREELRRRQAELRARERAVGGKG